MDESNSKRRSPEQQAHDALQRALAIVENKLEQKRAELQPLEDQVARLQRALAVLDDNLA